MLAIKHIEKLLSIFYIEYLGKPTASSLPINSALLIAEPFIKVILEFTIAPQKWGGLKNLLKNFQISKKSKASIIFLFIGQIKFFWFFFFEI